VGEARREFVVRIARAAGVVPAVLSLIEGRGEALGRTGDVDETDMANLHAALVIEHHAIALYDAGLERGLLPALLSAAFILVDEVRHMTIWRRLLGLKIY
jgi:hypothetical protein